MNVIRAAAIGMCFGVRDALRAAGQVDQPADVTIHGELVHNPQVLVQLQQRGFRMLDEEDRSQLPETTGVLITAHGISHCERRRLVEAGKQLIDTTCPLVRRVHEAAQRLQQDGFHVLLIGRPGHVEVQGIIEDLEHHDVIASAEDVQAWTHSRLGVICQSTTPPRHAAELLVTIEARNPHAEVRFVNTICHPTLERQYALEALCLSVDAVVVVGGPRSNNTRQLLDLARDAGTPAWQVQAAADLRAEWFTGCDSVGLTAGTSALDETVDAVEQALRSLTP
ncbi:MAG: 4-hydroxy-3-methylbut-2-enyl diphosphate reductase [Planctomycetaceae bacterium]|nr:4-hydroxy-3-methylbut-2-enyl diphosphate reductase [Planctomycetaceae bacterium]